MSHRIRWKNSDKAQFRHKPQKYASSTLSHSALTDRQRNKTQERDKESQNKLNFGQSTTLLHEQSYVKETINCILGRSSIPGNEPCSLNRQGFNHNKASDEDDDNVRDEDDDVSNKYDDDIEENFRTKASLWSSSSDDYYD